MPKRPRRIPPSKTAKKKFRKASPVTIIKPDGTTETDKAYNLAEIRRVIKGGKREAMPEVPGPRKFLTAKERGTTSRAKRIDKP